jgi:hypothetical protein
MTELERYKDAEGKYAWRVKKQTSINGTVVDEKNLTKKEKKEISKVLKKKSKSKKS